MEYTDKEKLTIAITELRRIRDYLAIRQEQDETLVSRLASQMKAIDKRIAEILEY